MFRFTHPRCPGKTFPAPTFLGLLLIWASTWPAWSAQPEPTRVDSLRLRALECERRGAWLEACRCYDEILRVARQDGDARKGQQRCLRRLHLIARHNDPAYRQALARLNPTQALDVYEQILGILAVAHPDRARVSLNHLFGQGLHELRLALDEPVFRQHYLPGVRPAALAAFRSRLTTWPLRHFATREEVREQALAVIRSARQDGLPLSPRLVCVLGMEFAAGACNGVDDYSAFLSPGPYALLQSPPRSTEVGVGIEVTWVGNGFEVTRVYRGGPAADKLQVGDRLLKIGAQPVAKLKNAEEVARELRGKPGSPVKVEVAPIDPTRPGEITLIRRAVPMPTVDYLTPTELADPLGLAYIRINYFGETTLQEVKAALAAMGGPAEIKGLILDLRGNPGGLFHPAVAIAELFLTEGVIVIGQSPFKEYNRPFKVETSGPLQMPLVVLVDAETASAAELLAGALKEGRQGSRPTKLLGQTTYGKGSIQCIIPLEKLLDRPTGIRLTVARLFSPSNQPYTGRGVAPTHPRDHKGIQLLREAFKELRALIEEESGMTPMPRTVVMGEGDLAS